MNKLSYDSVLLGKYQARSLTVAVTTTQATTSDHLGNTSEHLATPGNAEKVNTADVGGF